MIRDSRYDECIRCGLQFRTSPINAIDTEKSHRGFRHDMPQFIGWSREAFVINQCLAAAGRVSLDLALTRVRPPKKTLPQTKQKTTSSANRSLLGVPQTIDFDKKSMLGLLKNFAQNEQFRGPFGPYD